MNHNPIREAATRTINIDLCSIPGCTRTAVKAGSKAELLCMRHASGVISPIKRPKTASRNDPCPCKSGKKYKRCCIGKPMVLVRRQP